MTNTAKIILNIREKGGPGSGHHGHSGLPGKHGGSRPGKGGGVSATATGSKKKFGYDYNRYNQEASDIAKRVANEDDPKAAARRILNEEYDLKPSVMDEFSPQVMEAVGRTTAVVPTGKSKKVFDTVRNAFIMRDMSTSDLKKVEYKRDSKGIHMRDIGGQLGSISTTINSSEIKFTADSSLDDLENFIKTHGARRARKW